MLNARLACTLRILVQKLPSPSPTLDKSVGDRVKETIGCSTADLCILAIAIVNGDSMNRNGGGLARTPWPGRKMTKEIIVLMSIGIILAITGCDQESKGEISIRPEGNYLFSKIAIRKVESFDSNTVHFASTHNYAEETEIYSATTYDVDPGLYYVFLKYKNLDTLSTGWWQTTNDKLIKVDVGDEWTIDYGYFGGTIGKR
jgi:hypothetical protein